MFTEPHHWPEVMTLGTLRSGEQRRNNHSTLYITQDELWLAKWQVAIDFLETNHRKPSKFIPEERNMRSWWKHNKKLMNAGEMKPERVKLFERLLELGEKYKHVNQYQ